MLKTISMAFIEVALIAGVHECFGDGLPLSITKANTNVILTWPQASGNWVLVEIAHFDYCYVSNDVVYCETYPRKIISGSNYATNGTNISVVLPIDFSTNKFYMLRTNDFPPLPITVNWPNYTGATNPTTPPVCHAERILRRFVDRKR